MQKTVKSPTVAMQPSVGSSMKEVQSTYIVNRGNTNLGFALITITIITYSTITSNQNDEFV